MRVVGQFEIFRFGAPLCASSFLRKQESRRSPDESWGLLGFPAYAGTKPGPRLTPGSRHQRLSRGAEFILPLGLLITRLVVKYEMLI
jgi:hypothetical protein